MNLCHSVNRHQGHLPQTWIYVRGSVALTSNKHIWENSCLTAPLFAAAELVLVPTGKF